MSLFDTIMSKISPANHPAVAAGQGNFITRSRSTVREPISGRRGSEHIRRDASG
jgi:hypothetical protein